MEGFSPALNGYVDVEDQLSRSFLERADRARRAEAATKRSIRTVTDHESRVEYTRETFLERIGGLPGRIDDPMVETEMIAERDGYTIESVVYESHSGFHVAANCYVPASDGPHPGVLFLCGHVKHGKADPHNQRACIELASNGFVVLILDSIGQGERLQYRDPETGESIVSGGGGVMAHCYAGQQCFYAGSTLARYIVHDARCGLDYLCDRPDVDDGRVGVTGSSGGGIQTQFLMLLDDRIDVAAPCCSVTDRWEWLNTGQRIDAEQAIPGAFPLGLNHDDFVAAIAPRPVCIGAAASDQYFPIEGVHEAVDRVEQRYEAHDAAAHVDLLVTDQQHCSVYELGPEIFEWLCDRLEAGRYVPHDLEPVDVATLHCTEDGSVRAAFPDERTVDELIAGYVEHDEPPAVDDNPVSTTRRRLAERFDLDRDAPELSPRVVDHTEADGLAVDHVWFKTERDPDIVVAGVLVADPDTSPEAPAVVLYEDGTEAIPDRAEDLRALASEHGTVFVFDSRGVGAVRNREIPIHWWVDEYDAIYGTEFKLAYDALLLDTSLLALRVFDVLRAVEFLHTVTDVDRVSFVGEGVGAYHALYAAVATDRVDQVTLRDLGPSFAEMATQRDYPFRPQLTVFDVLADCDTPQLLAALDEREVSVDVTVASG